MSSFENECSIKYTRIEKQIPLHVHPDVVVK